MLFTQAGRSPFLSPAMLSLPWRGEELMTMKKLIAWASLPLLPMLGIFALFWLYATDDHDDYKSHPYSF